MLQAITIAGHSILFGHLLLCRGHSQERSLLKDVPSTIESKDVWIADRNFCTLDFTCSIASQKAYFAIREHKNYPFQLIGKEKYIGKTGTGKVYEQAILVVDSLGQNHNFRRIRVKLKKKIPVMVTAIFSSFAIYPKPRRIPK